MLDRLRLFANTPIADGDRPRLFAIAVVLILGVVATLALLDDAGPSPRPASAPAPRDGDVQPPAPLPVLAPPATPQVPSEESNPPPNLQARPDDIARGKRAARRFLKGYLAHTYGRDSKLTAATPELRAQLLRERPRVPATERRRRARVELLQSDSVTRERAELLAVIDDDARRYSIHLQLANTPTGWLVTELER
ncbi:hypothetical protein DVA67_017700 [Solirubrobacter sp. CPCC 204708]|uniref:DUF4878 domain-containing protein n=1 Tax=Solirubrobacter deserti TaxID=2282478 RepID=A0ABT4RD12_9ACTN|nr:hypothetical protein [Solirubrobacter deserti]MBE2317821.1 hypothetical protein [Solirubrobacter deserti]MDA0136402.1 hypothetical protein [Solirubrobacter deserti]